MTDAIRALAAATMVTGLAACGGGGTANLETFNDSASYAVGMNMGASIRSAGVDVSLDLLWQGLNDELGEGATAITELDARRTLGRFTQEAQAAQMARLQEEATANQEAGAAFLAENGARPGVTTTASGLQYEVLTEGDGPRPTTSDRVRVRYRGTLVDGTEFDATDPAGDGITFDVTGVIPGWTEALQLMTVGSTYKLYIPGNIAYGERGSPPDIGPMAMLIFEVELLGIE